MAQNTMDLTLPSLQVRLKNALEAAQKHGYKIVTMELKRIQLLTHAGLVVEDPKDIEELKAALPLVEKIRALPITEETSETNQETHGYIEIKLINEKDAIDDTPLSGTIRLTGDRKYNFPILTIKMNHGPHQTAILSMYHTLNELALRPQMLPAMSQFVASTDKVIEEEIYEGSPVDKALFGAAIIGIGIIIAAILIILFLRAPLCPPCGADEVVGGNATGRIEAVDYFNEKIHLRSTGDVPSTVEAIYIDGARYEANVPLIPGRTIDLDGKKLGFNIEPNQDIVVVGTNNLRAATTT